MASTLSYTAQDMNAANTVSHLISETVFADIRNYTSQQLVKRRLEPVSLYEFKRFYATKLLRRLNTGQRGSESPPAVEHTEDV